MIDLDYGKLRSDESALRSRTGTATFMAPETLLNLGSACLRRDLVSFLCVLIWVATFPKPARGV
jgi:hypothetical protein